MNRSSSLLFYKLVSAAILAGVVASLSGLAHVYQSPATATQPADVTAATQTVAHHTNAS